MNTKGLHWLFSDSRRQPNSFLHAASWSVNFGFFWSIQLCLLCGMVRQRCFTQFLWELHHQTCEPPKGRTKRVRVPLKAHLMGMFNSRVRTWSLCISWHFVAYTVTSYPSWAELLTSKVPNSTFTLFIQKQRHIANANQMPEVFEWCHIYRLPSIGILITLLRHNSITPFWFMGFPVFK